MSIYTKYAKQNTSLLTPIEGITFKQTDDIDLLTEINGITEDEAIARMANDHFAYVAFLHSKPAAFGWMATGKASIGELSHEFIIPSRHRYLWNFRTLEQYRGLGIYPLLLQFIIRENSDTSDQFWIIHAPENNSSLKGILKAGFEYLGDLLINDQLEAEISLKTNHHEHTIILREMAFEISKTPPASCWNCSSPYLKKRSSECCCNSAGNECINNKLAALV